jgi:hypothetical protein
VTWATDTQREKWIDSGWSPARKIHSSARSRCGVFLFRRCGRRWANPGRRGGCTATRHEIVLNYARRSNIDVSARRYVAAGLNELTSIIESLWPKSGAEI